MDPVPAKLSCDLEFELSQDKKYKHKHLQFYQICRHYSKDHYNCFSDVVSGLIVYPDSNSMKKVPIRRPQRLSIRLNPIY